MAADVVARGGLFARAAVDAALLSALLLLLADADVAEVEDSEASFTGGTGTELDSALELFGLVVVVVAMSCDEEVLVLCIETELPGTGGELTLTSLEAMAVGVAVDEGTLCMCSDGVTGGLAAVEEAALAGGVSTIASACAVEAAPTTAAVPLD